MPSQKASIDDVDTVKLLTEPDSLERLRGAVDKIDGMIRSLASQREVLCRMIGEEKLLRGMPVEDHVREAEVFSGLVKGTMARAAIYAMLFCSRLMQHEMRQDPASVWRKHHCAECYPGGQAPQPCRNCRRLRPVNAV